MSVPTTIWKQGGALPLRVEPLEDETLTSWMVRLLAAHQLRPISYVYLVDGQKIQFNRDWDGLAAHLFLPLLAEASCIPEECLRRSHTLLAFEGLLFPALGKGVTRWLLPRQARGNTCFRPWIQYCPACLSKADGFLRRWRLSLVTVCPEHALELQHRCPRCESPINFQKNDRGAARIRIPKLCICRACKFDLRKAPAVAADARDVEFGRRISSLLNGDFHVTPATSTLDFFNGLGLIMTAVAGRRSRLVRWREMLGEQIGAELPAPSGRGGFDELEKPSDRALALRASMWLTEQWPQRFLDSASAAGLRGSDFTQGLVDVTPWVAKAALALSPRPVGREITPGVKRLAEIREFIRARRRDWYRLPTLARRLKEAGFYESHFSNAIPLCRRIIKEIKEFNKGALIRATHQVKRGTKEWRRLLRVAAPFRKNRCDTDERLAEGILRLCRGRYLSARDLGDLLLRSQHVIKVKQLTPLVRKGLLVPLFKAGVEGIKNHPKQAYCTAEPQPKEEDQAAFAPPAESMEAQAAHADLGDF